MFTNPVIHLPTRWQWHCPSNLRTLGSFSRALSRKPHYTLTKDSWPSRNWIRVLPLRRAQPWLVMRNTLRKQKYLCGGVVTIGWTGNVWESPVKVWICCFWFCCFRLSCCCCCCDWCCWFLYFCNLPGVTSLALAEARDQRWHNFWHFFLRWTTLLPGTQTLRKRTPLSPIRHLDGTLRMGSPFQVCAGTTVHGTCQPQWLRKTPTWAFHYKKKDFPHGISSSLFFPFLLFC